MKIYDLRLKIVSGNDSEDECDGCGISLKKGDHVITGIESCCGECERQLCGACIGKAQQLLMQGVK